MACVIVLRIDDDGIVFLGELDCGRQGVRRFENAKRYKRRSNAVVVARQYGPEAHVLDVNDVPSDECPKCSRVGRGPECKAHRERWTDEQGHEHGLCHLCGVDCSTHPDAGNPLENCGDCGRVTCPDHRVEDAASRCNACAAVFYAEQAPAVVAALRDLVQRADRSELSDGSSLDTLRAHAALGDLGIVEPARAAARLATVPRPFVVPRMALRSLIESDDDGRALWWSNEDGWTVQAGATRFTWAEMKAFEARPAGSIWEEVRSC